MSSWFCSLASTVPKPGLRQQALDGPWTSLVVVYSALDTSTWSVTTRAATTLPCKVPRTKKIWRIRRTPHLWHQNVWDLSRLGTSIPLEYTPGLVKWWSLGIPEPAISSLLVLGPPPTEDLCFIQWQCWSASHAQTIDRQELQMLGMNLLVEGMMTVQRSLHSSALEQKSKLEACF